MDGLEAQELCVAVHVGLNLMYLLQFISGLARGVNLKKRLTGWPSSFKSVQGHWNILKMYFFLQESSFEVKVVI
jgi:hypothetical protein